MRIEQTGIQTIGAAQQTQAQSAALPEQGDVITATVQQSDGGAVVLKTDDGRVFHARLAENAALAENDRVEFIVTQSGRDGLVLRIAYVEPQAIGTGLPPARPEMLSGTMENALLQAFRQAGVSPDARAFATALQNMRQQRLSPKAALFFALNRMEPTAERVEAYAALTRGEGPGETLYETARGISATLGEPSAEVSIPGAPNDAVNTQNAQAAPAGGGIPSAPSDPENTQNAQAAPAGGGVSDVPNNPPNAQYAPPAPAGDGVSDVPGNPPNAQNATAAPAEGGVSDVPGNLPDTQNAPPAPAGGGVHAPPNNPPNAQNAPPTPAGDGVHDLPNDLADTRSPRAEAHELPTKILNLFLELTGDEDGEAIKKFVSESGEKINALKFMAGKYDEKIIRSARPQLERADEQVKLAQETTRFVCYQLPVHSGEYGTAELYVYRRAKGRGKIDADNASVLISIPTENFGRVEALIRTENKSLTLAFSVEKEGGVETLKEGIRELRKTLGAKTGYHLSEMRVSPLRERTTVENAEEVLSGSALRGGASLDVKV